MSTATVVLAILVALNSSTAAASPQSAGCSAAEYRQLDFWLGDWDVFEAGDATNSIARARVARIAAGCALHELYEQNDGLIGESILSFDAVRRVWQQTWVTNYGSLMVIVGRFKDGALTLQGEVHLRDGSSLLQRITWKTEGSAVRESAVMSKDGGKTWVPAFDVVFRKRQ
jgi:hypothetical protein